MNDRHQLSPFPLRISSDLRNWLKQQAAANYRSVNGEIEHRLASMRAAEERKGEAA